MLILSFSYCFSSLRFSDRCCCPYLHYFSGILEFVTFVLIYILYPTENSDANSKAPFQRWSSEGSDYNAFAFLSRVGLFDESFK